MAETKELLEALKIVKAQLPRYLMLIDDGVNEIATQRASASSAEPVFMTRRGAAMDHVGGFFEWLERIDAADGGAETCDGSCTSCSCGMG